MTDLKPGTLSKALNDINDLFLPMFGTVKKLGLYILSHFAEIIRDGGLSGPCDFYLCNSGKIK